MTLDPQSPPALHIAQVYRAYACLVQFAQSQETLGGQLLYTGELNPAASHLIRAANIAGAASLAASASAAVLRQALHQGAIDILVNSLDEALRILKNEIRKRQPVSVGVAADPTQLADQMLDRGVLPDILPSGKGLNPEQQARFVNQRSRQIVAAAYPSGSQFVIWQIDRDFARWLPRLDECAKAALPSEDHMRPRWLRLAPRYLGRLAQRQRGVVLNVEEFAKFQVLVNQQLAQVTPEAGETPKVTIEKIDF